MTLRDVRQVFVVQDRATGAFVEINMGFCQSLRHAARAESLSIAHESMNSAIYEGQLECPDGYEVHSFYENND